MVYSAGWDEPKGGRNKNTTENKPVVSSLWIKDKRARRPLARELNQTIERLPPFCVGGFYNNTTQMRKTVHFIAMMIAVTFITFELLAEYSIKTLMFIPWFIHQEREHL